MAQSHAGLRGAGLRRVVIIATVLGFTFAGGFGLAVAAQPRMQAALTALQSALGELQAADADKAGHRAKAMTLVQQAIRQVEAGIAAAR